MFIEPPHLRPQIVTPEMIPPILDLDTAMRDEGYAWAVLAVAMHPGWPSKPCFVSRPTTMDAIFSS